MRARRHFMLASRVSLLMLSVLLAGCASAATHSAPHEGVVEVTLQDDQKKAEVDLGDHHYRLALAQIVDSRCPANAQCVWAGELSARISIQRVDKGAATREVTLGEHTVPTLEIMGAKLDLVSIDEKSVTFTMRTSEER